MGSSLVVTSSRRSLQTLVSEVICGVVKCIMYFSVVGILPFKAWAMATLHSKRNSDDDTSDKDAIEDDAIVRNFRWVAKNLQQQVQNFKPQELSNSVWAWATTGFGYDESIGLNVHNDYTYVVSNTPSEDKILVHDTLEIVAKDALSRLDKFKVRSVSKGLLPKNLCSQTSIPCIVLCTGTRTEQPSLGICTSWS